MKDFEYTDLPFSGLVQKRQISMDCTALFVTISPNPKTNVECIMKNVKTGKNRTMKRPYGMLPQKVQYEYCLKCIREDYIPFLSEDVKLVGITELNQSGNVHLHMVINEKTIHDEVTLQMFRRDILNGVRTQQNITKGQINPKDWMNNIVFITKSKKDIIDYCMKDQSAILPHFKNYYL